MKRDRPVASDPFFLIRATLFFMSIGFRLLGRKWFFAGMGVAGVVAVILQLST